MRCFRGVVFLTLSLISCTRQERSELYSAGGRLRVEKLKIQTFETAYDRQEFFYDKRLIGYVGSNYLMTEGTDNGHMVLPVRRGKLEKATVVAFGVIKPKYFPWYLYVSPGKFTRAEFEDIVRLTREIMAKQGLIEHQAYYLAGAVYYDYTRLNENYRHARDKNQVLEIGADGKLWYLPDAAEPAARRFFGNDDGVKIPVKSYWLGTLKLDDFHDAQGRKFTDVYRVQLVGGM